MDTSTTQGANLMTREEMIEFLVDSDFDHIMNDDGGLELLRDYLDTGHKGYRHLLDAELRVEVEQRKLMRNA
jgi:hypothetical protein